MGHEKSAIPEILIGFQKLALGLKFFRMDIVRLQINEMPFLF